MGFPTRCTGEAVLLWLVGRSEITGLPIRFPSHGGLRGLVGRSEKHGVAYSLDGVPNPGRLVGGSII